MFFERVSRVLLWVLGFALVLHGNPGVAVVFGDESESDRKIRTAIDSRPDAQFLERGLYPGDKGAGEPIVSRQLVLSESGLWEQKTGVQLGSILTAMVDDYERSSVAFSKWWVSGHFFENSESGRIRIEILAPRDVEDCESEFTVIEEFGGSVLSIVGNRVEAFLPIWRVRDLALALERSAVVIRVALPSIPADIGDPSEGVEVSGAWSYHAHGYDGSLPSRRRVAVVDTEFLNLDRAMDFLEVVPADTILVDCSAGPCAELTDVSEFSEECLSGEHGTNCAKIVADMAPGVQLYAVCVYSDNSHELAKDYILDQGVEIVSHSLGVQHGNFHDGQCYEDQGYVNQVCVTDDAFQNGVLWVTSAGNSSKRQFSGEFFDSDQDGYNDEFVDFLYDGTGEFEFSLNYDAWPTTDVDYDLCIFDDTGSLRVCTSLDQSGSEPPFERMIGSSPPFDAGTYRLRVRRSSTEENISFKITSHTGGIELSSIPLMGTLSIPADAASALAVGAVAWENWTSGAVTDYSSRGPTTDGRTKPDIAGPTSVVDWVGDLGGFAGTSASAPHVAGAAVLIWSANPGYSMQNVWNHLTSTAIDDTGEPGLDNYTGHGRLNLCLEPIIPVASSPLRAESGQHYEVSWTETTRDRIYEVQEDESPGFGNPVIWTVHNSESWSFSHSVVDPTIYYYRVRAKETCSGLERLSSWSNVPTVTVGGSTGWIDLTQSATTLSVNESVRFSVDVYDRFGELVGVGTPVTFSTTHPVEFFGNGCSSPNSPSTVTTDTSGHTWIDLTSTVVGTASISVTSSGASGTVGQVSFQNPNADLNISISVGYMSGSGSTTTYGLEAVVTNGSGSPVSGERVDFLTTSGNLSVGYDFTGPTGVADVNLTVSSSGSVTVTASAGGNQTATTFYAQVGGGDPPQMMPTQIFVMDDDVNGVDFSPDGATLVAGSYGGDLKAWSTSDYSSKWSTTTTDDRLGQVSVSPNNTYVMAEMDDGSEIHYLSNGNYYCVGGNADSKGIIGTWTSNSAYLGTSFEHIYRHSSVCATGALTSYQPDSGSGFERASHMDFNDDKSWVALNTDEGDLLVLNSSGSLVTKIDLTASSDNAFDTSFSSNGSRLAGVAYGVAKVYNTSTWSATSYAPPNMSDFKYSVVFIDNDTKIAFGGQGRVEVVDLSGGASIRYGDVSGNAVEMAWNPVTEELAVGTSSGNLYIFEPLEAPLPVDITGPTIAVNHPADESSTNDPFLTTTGRVTDATGVAGFSVNGTPVSLNASGDFSHTMTLVEGSNTITYWAQDSASGGNESTTTRSVTLVVDTIPPVISNSAVAPSLGTAGTVFAIQTDVVDGDTGVGSVTATIKSPGGGTVATLPMGNAGGSTYTVSLNSTGFETGYYTVDITAVDSSLQQNSRTIVSAAGFEIVLCTYAVLPTSATFGANGGSGAVTVSAPSVCDWTAISNDSWITITSGSTGTGGGTVEYSVSVNVSPDARTGTMTIADQTFTVLQDGGGCEYSISPISASFDAGGGSGSVSVTATVGCAWDANSNDSWIMIDSGSNGSGSGNVTYSVGSNGSLISRQGTMTIVGHVFTVLQGGLVDPGAIFLDGFEGGDPSQWSDVVGWVSLDNGLVGYWPMDGDSDDVTGNGHDGILEGDVTFEPGIQGGAAAFDGLDDRIRIDDQVPYQNEFSFLGWVRFDGSPQNGTATIFSKNASCNYANQSLSVYFSSGTIHVDVSDFGDPWYLRASVSLTLGRWYHLATTVAPGSVRIFLDGEMVAEAPLTGEIDSGSCFIEHAIGGGPATAMGGPWSHNGLIDEVRVYNRALSPSEVQRLSALPCDGLGGCYPFEGNADDVSGNGNHGLVDGAAATIGRFGAGYEFTNGTTSSVSIPRTVFDNFGNTAYVEAWVFPTGGTGATGTIFRKRGAFNDWSLYQTADGRVTTTIFGYVGTGGTNGWQAVGVVSPDPLPLNTWSKVSSWYDGATITLSIDDVPVASDERVLPLVWDSPTCPGDTYYEDGCYYGTWVGSTSTYSRTDVNPAETFSGKIDEVRVSTSPSGG